MICVSDRGGCGFIGSPNQFGGNSSDPNTCPKCFQPTGEVLTSGNLDSVTSHSNRRQARQTLSMILQTA